VIKYYEAKKILSRYQGTGGFCPDAEDIDLFVRQVLEYMLIHGTYGGERTFEFQAENGCVTLPYELETPLKLKIGDAIGSVWSRWFEYHSGNRTDDYCLAETNLLTQPNRYPTVYDVRVCGEYVAVTSVCEEDDGAHIVVKGEDSTGRTIYTFHQGEQIVGEYLSIKKGQLTRSTVKFAKITEVSKTRTKGYATLLAIDDTGLSRRFLSDYGPYDTAPSYQRARIISQPCPPVCGVKILGRIRLKEHYADDDVIPFDNLLLLSTSGQTINSMYNDQVEIGAAKHTFAKGLIETEGNFKKVNNGQPIEIFRPLSGGHIIDPQRRRYRLRRRGV